MKQIERIPQKSIFYAPLEGITDSLFRESIFELFPEWDFLMTEFIRIPTTGKIKEGHLLNHIGSNIYNSSYFSC